MKINVHEPPWPHAFVSDGVAVCMYCQKTDLPVLVRGIDLEALGDKAEESPRPGVVGVCEVCSVHALWVWRTNSGEAQPVFDDEAIKKVSRVKVVLARIKTLPNGDRADPALVDSYDFAMMSDEGAIDLPGDDLGDGEPEESAVQRALEKLRAFTWPAFAEPLYKAYTPRGKLVSVVFVSAWGMLSGDFDKSHWRAWPPEQWVVPGMKGFYAGFENAWALRIHKRQSAAAPTDEISVYVREAAVRYIRLQQQLRSGQKPDDLSMVDYLRQSMSSDEKRVEAKLRKLAESAMNMKAERSEGVTNMGNAGDQGLVRTSTDARLPGEEDLPEPDGDGESGEDGSGSGVDGPDVHPVKQVSEPPAEASGSEEDEEANEWPDLHLKPGEEIIEGEFTSTEQGAGSPEPGFVRIGRDLTTTSRKSG